MCLGKNQNKKRVNFPISDDIIIEDGRNVINTFTT